MAVLTPMSESLRAVTRFRLRGNRVPVRPLAAAAPVHDNVADRRIRPRRPNLL